MLSMRTGTALSALALLAACQVVPATEPPPQLVPSPSPSPVAMQAPAPRAVPTPAPTPTPPPVAAVPDEPWDVADLTPGNWSYRKAGQDSIASFGTAGAAPRLTLQCNRAAREMSVVVTGVARAAATMTIRTSNGDLKWPAFHDPKSGGLLVTIRPARDPGFDEIAFSRGRIAIESTGMARLIVPVWAEVSRAVEDCRG